MGIKKKLESISPCPIPSMPALQQPARGLLRQGGGEGRALRQGEGSGRQQQRGGPGEGGGGRGGAQELPTTPPQALGGPGASTLGSNISSLVPK